jgi:hypothetical protein
MADQRLVDYIVQSLQMGYPSDYIAQILLEQGWNIDQINEAISIVQGRHEEPQAQQAEVKPVQQPQPSAKASRPRGVTLICLIGFLSAVLMLVAGALLIGLGGLVGYDALMLGNPAEFNFNLLSAIGLENTGDVASLFGLAGVIFVVLAVMEFVGFLLLWKMKRIGWVLITATGVITIVIAMTKFDFSYYILTVVVSASIICYLLAKRKTFN